jgi:hemolysin activation/secretion protein
MLKPFGFVVAFILAATAATAQTGASMPSRLSSSPAVDVKAYRLHGNTAFAAEELAAVLQPWIRSGITTEDLVAVRNALTAHYVQHGFINSGATVPDQEIVDGVVDVVITEGRLTRVDVVGARWFRRAYFERRMPVNGSPLNVADLERRLQQLQRSGRGRRLDATLSPGRSRGEGDLTLVVQEQFPLTASVEYSNHQAPSIGGQRGEVSLEYDSLTGNGDVLRASFGKTRGLDDLSVAYSAPLFTTGTVVGFQFRSGESVVTEEPFDAVDIESWSRTYTASVSHAVRTNAGSEWTVGISGDVRESRTWLLGRPFSFSEGAVNGQSRVAVIRGLQSWMRSTRTHVVAVRSQVSVGIDAAGASNDDTPVRDMAGGLREPADGTFVSWLGQFQWARRLALLQGTEIIARADAQISRDPLLALEQFAIGGHASVRGYRENQIVRDSGAVASFEIRMPVVAASGRPLLRVGPFMDAGAGWNRRRATPTPRSIASVGVAWQANMHRDRIVLSGAWGHALRDVGTDGDLQDAGLHFGISVRAW